MNEQIGNANLQISNSAFLRDQRQRYKPMNTISPSCKFALKCLLMVPVYATLISSEREKSQAEKYVQT